MIDEQIEEKQKLSNPIPKKISDARPSGRQSQSAELTTGDELDRFNFLHQNNFNPRGEYIKGEDLSPDESDERTLQRCSFRTSS